jgi:hypothetical protein
MIVLLARDLARWLVWRSGAYSPRRPKAAGMRPVTCGPHGPPPGPMPRSKASPGSDARHRSPDVILGFALFFPIIFACLSLSLLFRQSLLYDSQFNISIRTQLISTCSSLLRIFPRGLRYPVPFNKIFTFCAIQGTGDASVTRNKLPRAPDPRCAVVSILPICDCMLAQLATNLRTRLYTLFRSELQQKLPISSKLDLTFHYIKLSQNTL